MIELPPLTGRVIEKMIDSNSDYRAYIDDDRRWVEAVQASPGDLVRLHAPSTWALPNRVTWCIVTNAAPVGTVGDRSYIASVVRIRVWALA